MIRIISRSLSVLSVVLFSMLLLLVCRNSTASPAPLPHSHYFTSICTSCHVDDDPTCNGCHKHGNHSLNAVPDKSLYSPGEEVIITFSGGSKYGWVRGMLNDIEGTEIDRKTGPTFNGNNGGALVEFPMELRGRAPGTAGSHTWTAKYFGNNNGSGHAAIDVPFTIDVGSTADLVVNIIPATTPMFLGPGGGAVHCSVELVNTTAFPVPLDGWIDLTLPNGNHYGPVLGPVHTTLPGSANITQPVVFNIPGIAPSGVYSFNVYIGDYLGGALLDADSFAFIKE